MSTGKSVTHLQRRTSRAPMKPERAIAKARAPSDQPGREQIALSGRHRTSPKFTSPRGEKKKKKVSRWNRRRPPTRKERKKRSIPVNRGWRGIIRRERQNPPRGKKKKKNRRKQRRQVPKPRSASPNKNGKKSPGKVQKKSGLFCWSLDIGELGSFGGKKNRQIKSVCRCVQMGGNK